MGYPYPPRKVVGLLLLIALISLFAGCNEDAANVMLAGDSAGNSQPDDGEGAGDDNDDDSTPPARRRCFAKRTRRLSKPQAKTQ